VKVRVLFFLVLSRVEFLSENFDQNIIGMNMSGQRGQTSKGLFHNQTLLVSGTEIRGRNRELPEKAQQAELQRK
jgi:hypothetical protein